MCLLSHRGAAADRLEAGLLVMPDEPVRVEIDDEGFAVGVSGGQDVRGGRTRLPCPGTCSMKFA